jgi:hypothetical protein
MISPITNTYTKIKNKCEKASFDHFFASLEKIQVNSRINNIKTNYFYAIIFNPVINQFSLLSRVWCLLA